MKEPVIGVIPARYDSKRFPGKLLADLNGMSVLERTWRQAMKASRLDRLVIAAGDEKIAEAGRRFGAEVVECFEAYRSGSDRVWGAVLGMQSAECRVQSAECRVQNGGETQGHFSIILNIQGDEPFLEPEVIDRVVARIEEDKSVDVATAIAPIRTLDEFNDPSLVKVVMDRRGWALYFSRAPIPHGWTPDGGLAAYGHIGLYAYRWEALERFAGLEQGELERGEKLEQLRLLDANVSVGVEVVNYRVLAVDTNQDIEKLQRLKEELQS